jgi:hypothetical protein
MILFYPLGKRPMYHMISDLGEEIFSSNMEDVWVLGTHRRHTFYKLQSLLILQRSLPFKI